MFKMTWNILENVSKKSATRLYPFEVREPFEDARGELYCDVEECIFCMTCARKCPSQCLSVDKKAQTWVCDTMACVFCGICVDACPVNCLGQKAAYRPVTSEREVISLKSNKPPKVPKKAKAEDAPAAAE